MKHTVKVTPGLTIIATLIGGTLLGLIGALVAIPVAATIHLLLKRSPFPARISGRRRNRQHGRTPRCGRAGRIETPRLGWAYVWYHLSQVA